MDDHLHPDIDLLADNRKTRRQRLLDRFQGRCAFCGEDNPTTLDHLIPKSQGGSDAPGNLIPACLRCNGRKGSQDWWRWFPAQPFYRRDVAIRLSEWGEPFSQVPRRVIDLMP